MEAPSRASDYCPVNAGEPRRPRSATGEVSECDRRVHRRADGQRRLVEDDLVRVIARRRGRVLLGRAGAQEDHRPGHALVLIAFSAAEFVRSVREAQASGPEPLEPGDARASSGGMEPLRILARV